MKTKNILLSILVIALVTVLVVIWMGYYQKSIEKVKNPIVTMEIEDYGTVVMELYPDKAPNTVANFVKLVNEGYYNGLTYHRVIADLLIQGGDKQGTGAGTESFCIPGEFYANNYKKNDMRHEEGTLSMARADYSSLGTELVKKGYDSASTQFFISLTPTSSFDGLYAAFGKVISGLDIVKQISNLETKVEKDEETEKETKTDTPVNAPVIKSMTVETFGVDYGEPERLEPFDYYNWMLQQYSKYQNSNSIILPE